MYFVCAYIPILKEYDEKTPKRNKDRPIFKFE